MLNTNTTIKEIIESHSEDIQNIVNEIIESYTIDKKILKFGFQILCYNDNEICVMQRDSLILTDDFKYDSDSVNRLNKIVKNDYIKMGIFKEKSYKFSCQLKTIIQMEICDKLKLYFKWILLQLYNTTYHIYTV